MGEGRPVFSGRVVRGQGRGHALGFPTANLTVAGSGHLPRGVYAARIYGAASDPCWAVANIGRRPTFGGHELAVEVHVLDFTGDLYERNLLTVFRFHADCLAFVIYARLVERRIDELAWPIGQPCDLSIGRYPIYVHVEYVHKHADARQGRLPHVQFRRRHRFLNHLNHTISRADHKAFARWCHTLRISEKIDAPTGQEQA